MYQYKMIKAQLCKCSLGIRTLTIFPLLKWTVTTLQWYLLSWIHIWLEYIDTDITKSKNCRPLPEHTNELLPFPVPVKLSIRLRYNNVSCVQAVYPWTICNTKLCNFMQIAVFYCLTILWYLVICISWIYCLYSISVIK